MSLLPSVPQLNPMLQFNGPQTVDAGNAMRQLFVMLGGLGGPTTNPLTPGLSSPEPQPQPDGQMAPILGPTPPAMLQPPAMRQDQYSPFPNWYNGNPTNFGKPTG